jgi:hypothetical protein
MRVFDNAAEEIDSLRRDKPYRPGDRVTFTVDGKPRTRHLTFAAHPVTGELRAFVSYLADDEM